MYAHVQMDLTSGTMASRVTKLSKVHKGQDQTGPIDQTLHSKTHLDKSTEITDRITYLVYCFCATDKKLFFRIISESFPTDHEGNPYMYISFFSHKTLHFILHFTLLVYYIHFPTIP